MRVRAKESMRTYSDSGKNVFCRETFDSDNSDFWKLIKKASIKDGVLKLSGQNAISKCKLDIDFTKDFEIEAMISSNVKAGNFMILLRNYAYTFRISDPIFGNLIFNIDDLTTNRPVTEDMNLERKLPGVTTLKCNNCCRKPLLHILQ
jgi:hypothetical protein